MRLQVERGRRLDRAFAAVAAGLEPRERAFAQELAYGTTRLRGRLDHLLERHLDRSLPALQPVVREVLRLGAYQVLEMGGVPVYAAVSESVELARSRGAARAAGLVNAVLRRVAADGARMEFFPAPAADLVGFLSTWGSHPRWMVERWLERYGPEVTRALVEADNTRPELYLVPLRTPVEEALAALAAAGVAADAVPDVPGVLRVEGASTPQEALAAVPDAVVQDPAAHLVVRYAGAEPGTKVADLCSAPGGKALALARHASYTLAADRSEVRLRMVRDNALRTGVRVGCVVADAASPPVRPVDLVLLDAPCTGTGTLRRHPDARWSLMPGDVAKMAAVQDRLLEGAAAAVAVGGVLVYATCSLEPEENEERVEAFLARHPEFSLESSDTVPGRFVDARGRLSVRPGAWPYDGAFAARLRRAA